MDDIKKTVIAFANTLGGRLYIGIDDDGNKWVLDDYGKPIMVPDEINDDLDIAGLDEAKQIIRNLVRESFNELGAQPMSLGVPSNYDQMEVKGLANSRAHSHKPKLKNPDVNNHNKMVKKNTKDDEKRSGKAGKGKRAIVLTWLKDPAVNCAEIMRKLWNPTEEEEDAARSYFYKCRDGKLNDSGVPYKFSDSDINSLYKIKSEKSA